MTSPRRTRPAALLLGAGLTAVALLLAACSDDDPGADPTETTSESPQPTLTAPPTETPEEEAQAAITDALEGIVAARDEFNANAADYTSDQLASGDLIPWRATGNAELDLLSQADIWLTTQLEAVGTTVIASHEVSDYQPGTDGEIIAAQSSACLDITGITYRTYDGTETEPPFTPDPAQIWNMTWELLPTAEEPGWYLTEVQIERGTQPC